MREEQVAKHRCVGELQQQCPVNGPLTEMAAYAFRQRQLAQGRSQDCESEAKEGNH